MPHRQIAAAKSTTRAFVQKPPFSSLAASPCSPLCGHLPKRHDSVVAVSPHVIWEQQQACQSVACPGQVREGEAVSPYVSIRNSKSRPPKLSNSQSGCPPGAACSAGECGTTLGRRT